MSLWWPLAVLFILNALWAPTILLSLSSFAVGVLFLVLWMAEKMREEE